MNAWPLMKKLTTGLMVLAVAVALTQTALAGDREWATAGKVLTGVVLGAAIVHAVQPQPTYVYTTPPVVYASAPAPVVHAPRPVIYAPPRVVYALPSPPVVVCSAPIYRRPAPRVCLQFGNGHGHHHFRGPGYR